MSLQHDSGEPVKAVGVHVLLAVLADVIDQHPLILIQKSDLVQETITASERENTFNKKKDFY